MIPYMSLLVAVLVIVFSRDSVVFGSTSEAKDLPITDALDEKWGNIFNLGDTDNDGIYSLDDEFSMAQKLIEYHHTSGDVTHGLMQYWELYKDVIEAYFGMGTTKAALTRSEYVAAHRWYWIHNYDQFKHRVQAFYTAVFHAMDSDNDNAVSFQQLQDAYERLGDSELIEKTVKNVFKLIDADGDGTIAENEFPEAHLKYALDPDITAKELPLF